MSVRVDRMNWRVDKEDILVVEREAFPPNMHSDERDLFQYVRDGYGLVVRRHGIIRRGTIDGYVVAVPLERVSYKGCQDDVDRGLKNSAYVESLAIRPEAQPSIFMDLVTELRETLIKEGFRKVKMHVPVDEKLYNGLIAFGARELGRFGNFMGWGKTFAYLEFQL